MKKVLYIAISVAFLLGLAACNRQAEPVQPEPTTELVNPMKAFASIDALCEAVDVKLAVPQDAADIELFSIADYIAEIDFSLDGRSYTLRAAKGEEQDISGVYETFEEQTLGVCVDAENYGVTFDIKFVKDGGALVLWTNEGMSYSLYSTDETVHDTNCEIQNVATRIMEAMYPVQ